MHEEFIEYGTPAIKLIEELTELNKECIGLINLNNTLIKTICKGERFGYDDFNPKEAVKLRQTNRAKIRQEISDVNYALKIFARFLDRLNIDIKRKY